jgi:hypothetical protein
MDDFIPSNNADNEHSEHNDKVDKSYQNAIYEVAKFLRPADASKFKHKFGMKQLSNQVIELDKNIYIKNVAANVDNFYITDKVDGKRTIIYIKDAEHVYAINHELRELKADLPKHTNVCIFDCEMYGEHDGHNAPIIYYVFDVMVWNGSPIINKPFSERLKYIQDAVKMMPNILKDKPFIKLDKLEYREQIKEFKAKKKPYDVDGIILTPADGQYVHMQVYKYKPLSHLSIDFLIKKCPPSLLGIEPYNLIKDKTLYLLFSGISSNSAQTFNMQPVKSYEDMFPHINTKHLPKYFPIQFEPSDKTRRTETFRQ